MKIIDINNEDRQKLIESGFSISNINGVEVLKDDNNYIGLLSKTRLLLTDNELGYFILKDLLNSLEEE